MLGKMGLDQLRLFAGGENLVTFSEWRGFDAEANNGSSSNGYPTPKTYSLGLEIAF
jgi:hypothetical protein